MDETIGCARVNVQFGDDDTNIAVTKQLIINKTCLNTIIMLTIMLIL